jgi:O-antigen/teichoic acid export membrane protein
MTDSHPQRVLSNALPKIVWVLSGGIISRLASGLATIVVLYFLTAAEYGELTTVLFWGLLISLLAGAGLSDLIVKMRFETVTVDARAQLLNAWAVAVFVGSAATVLIYFGLIRGAFSPAGTMFYLFCGTASVFAAMVMIAQAALRADGRAIEMAQLMIGTSVATSGGLVLFAWYGSDMIVLGQWYLASSALAFLLHVVVLLQFELVGIARIKLCGLRDSLTRSLSFGLVHLHMLMLPIVSGTLVLYLCGEDAAGSYNLIIALFLAGTNIGVVLDQMFYPVLIASNCDRSRRATSYLVLSLFVSLPAIILFCLNGQSLAHAIFPEKYTYVPQLIVALGVLIPLRFTNGCLVVSLRIQGRNSVSVRAYGAAILCLLGFAFAFDQLGANPVSPLQIMILLFGVECLAFSLMIRPSYNQFDLPKALKRITQLGLMTLFASTISVLVFRYSGSFDYSILAAAIAYCTTAYLTGVFSKSMLDLRH